MEETAQDVHLEEEKQRIKRNMIFINMIEFDSNHKRDCDYKVVFSVMIKLCLL